MKFAGLLLKDNIDEDSVLAIADSEETSIWNLSTNDEIIEKIEEKEIDILAADVGMEQGRDDLTKKEQKLEDEGYNFVPSGHQVKKMKRLESLSAHLEHAMGVDAPEIIRFNPHITSEELAIHGDQALESLGFDTGPLSNSHEFDALLGAVTGRYYEQGAFRDMGVIIPGEKDEEEDQDDEVPKDPRE